MADENSQQVGAEGETLEEPDYKALYETAQAEADKWKALSRKNEQQARSNADAASQLRDLTQRLAAIEGERDQLKAQREHDALVAKVAQATGVPASIVSTLAATEEEALTQAATAIADAYKVPGGAPYVPEAGKFAGEQGADAEMRKFAHQLFTGSRNQ